MKTRRQFFGTLFRSVATAAAMVYAPKVLDAPRSNVICDDVVTVNGLKKEFAVAMERFRQFKDKDGVAYFDHDDAYRPAGETDQMDLGTMDFAAERKRLEKADGHFGYFEAAPDMKAIAAHLRRAARKA